MPAHSGQKRKCHGCHDSGKTSFYVVRGGVQEDPRPNMKKLKLISRFDRWWYRIVSLRLQRWQQKRAGRRFARSLGARWLKACGYPPEFMPKTHWFWRAVERFFEGFMPESLEQEGRRVRRVQIAEERARRHQ
jgi:hypothetical protein